MKRLRFIFFIFAMAIIINCVPAKAADDIQSGLFVGGSAVALGDSIAAGYGAPEGWGYPEQTADMLRTFGRYKKLENLAADGLDTEGLMHMLYHEPEIIGAVAGSGLVFVSIGASNVLLPVFDALNRLDLSGRTAVQAQDEISRVIDNSLLDKLASGAAAFARDWPAIVLRIRELSPDADIYVMTVYNPAKPENRAVYPFLEIPLDTVNKVIRDNAAYGAYTVVDAHEAFETGDKLELTRFDLFNLKFDHHPSEAGYQLLARLKYEAVTQNQRRN